MRAALPGDGPCATSPPRRGLARRGAPMEAWLSVSGLDAEVTDGDQFARLSVSLPSNLLELLDSMTAERHNASRSQTVAELIRQELDSHGARPTDALIAGTITLVYRTESGRVRHALAQTQLGYIKEVISSQHVFLEEDHSREVLLVQGPAERLQQLCDDLRRIRSVEQITLVTTSSLLPPLHAAGEAEPAQAAHDTGAPQRDAQPADPVAV